MKAKRGEQKERHVTQLRFGLPGQVKCGLSLERWGHRRRREWGGEMGSGAKRGKACQQRRQSAKGRACTGHHWPTLAGRREGRWGGKRGDGLVESEFDPKYHRQPLGDYEGKQRHPTWILASSPRKQHVGWSGRENCQ